MVSVHLPSDALLQHLPNYLGFSYLGREVSLHGCSSKAQPVAPYLGLRGCRRAKRSYSMFKVRRGGHEEIPVIHGLNRHPQTMYQAPQEGCSLNFIFTRCLFFIRLDTMYKKFQINCSVL